MCSFVYDQNKCVRLKYEFVRVENLRWKWITCTLYKHTFFTNELSFFSNKKKTVVKNVGKLLETGKLAMTLDWQGASKWGQDRKKPVKTWI